MESALPVAAIASVSLLAGLSPAAARYAPRPRDQALARHLAEAWLQPRPAGYANLPARDAESACRLRGYRGVEVTGGATRGIGNRRTGVSVGVAATVFAA